MIKFILGISITFNIISIIAFFFIYKYSFKNLKNKLESMLVNNFVEDGTKEYFNNLKKIESGFNEDDN